MKELDEELSYDYISCQLCSKDTGELIDLLFNNGCAIGSKHDFHITVVWDPRKELMKKPLVSPDKHLEFKAHVIGFDVLGEDKDTPVLLLSSRELHQQHNLMLEAGHQHSFPDYLPHISINYDVDKYEIEKLRLLLGGYAGKELTFNNLAYGH